MIAKSPPLPLSQSAEPASLDELTAAVGDALAGGLPIYPIGGGTSLDYGLPAGTPGMGIHTTALNRIEDYPARDMTITVEAGIGLARLAATLASERQWLPVDAPQAEQATLGGLLATNHSGPRRYGYGTLRDYVIGIQAVDGHGRPFRGGGRVVKNVAGYDFCKLLIGSLGTLGVISQVTLKVRPRPAASALIHCPLADLNQAERLLADLVNLAAPPSAIEWLAGPAWDEHSVLSDLPAGPAGRLVVGLEGSAAEVDWLAGEVVAQWHAAGVAASRRIAAEATEGFWQALCDFSVAPSCPLALKISVLPSQTAELVGLLRGHDPELSLEAHAGNGIVVVRFSRFRPSDVSELLLARLHPLAAAHGGSITLLAGDAISERTRPLVWGPPGGGAAAMQAIKARFDPQGLLNRGRFIF